MTYLRLVRRPWPRTVLLTVFAEGFLFFGAFAYVGLALHGPFGLSYSMVGWCWAPSAWAACSMCSTPRPCSPGSASAASPAAAAA